MSKKVTRLETGYEPATDRDEQSARETLDALREKAITECEVMNHVLVSIMGYMELLAQVAGYRDSDEMLPILEARWRAQQQRRES